MLQVHEDNVQLLTSQAPTLLSLSNQDSLSTITVDHHNLLLTLALILLIMLTVQFNSNLSQYIPEDTAILKEN